MKELVEVIAKALVDCPDEVSVSEKQEGRTTVLELHVAESDMGKVIGKQGRIAKAIRSVVKAAAARHISTVIQILPFLMMNLTRLQSSARMELPFSFLPKLW